MNGVIGGVPQVYIRHIHRQKYLDADVGITGANFLIAETGSSIIVTNEGNGDLTQTLPRVHIALASIEKVVPTLEDVATLMRLLPRHGTGQTITNAVSGRTHKVKVKRAIAGYFGATFIL